MPPRLSGHRHLHLQVHHLPWQDKAVIQKAKVISTATCLYSPGHLRMMGGRLIESRSSADCRLGNEREQLQAGLSPTKSIRRCDAYEN